jgi:hypothetical protein
LVEDAIMQVGKPLRGSYQEKIIRLKATGFHEKVAQVAGLEAQVAVLDKQLEDTHNKLDKAKAQIKQLKSDQNKPNAATPDKKKGKKAIVPKPVSTNSLDLPPPIEERPTMTAPMSAMTYAALPDSIIEAGVSMMRATDDKDWPDRARNWVVLAESRPRFTFK